MGTDKKQGGTALGRIFLSHKSVDKAAVRDYYETLELLGLNPWLDENDLLAGAELHRALQKGMQESCAAVFFITPAYQDEKFLRAEINHAIEEKTQRGDEFSVITLVIEDPAGKVGTVPDPLKPYVWKRPKTALEGLRDILRALPAPFRDIRPASAPSAEPNVRIKVTPGQIFSPGPPREIEDVVMVRFENHGTQPVYLSGGVSFDRDDVVDKHYWVGRDAIGNWSKEKEVAPGNGFDVTIAISQILEHANHIRHFFFRDQLSRTFQTDEGETREALKAAQKP